MESALVGVATGVMKPLLSKLSTLLEKEYAKFKNVHRDTQFLRDEMRSMEAALETLADAEQLDREVEVWRDDVRDLSYDMEDCVDDFMARVHQEPDESTRIQKFFDKFRKLKPRVKIGDEIEEIKTRLIEASDRHKRYAIAQPTPGSSTCDIDPRLHALYVEVDKLVGIGGPKKHIIDWYERESSSSQLKVVSIVGPGGLGKTTLANQVYHTMKGQFSCVAFVSVSRKPDMKNILRQIAKGVGITDVTSDDDVQPLIDKLRDHLKDKRYFVVIDDVWGTEAWETIRHALLNNNCSSRIITTTRINKVAACSSSQGGHIYEMKPLSFVDSKRLFLKRVFGSEDLCHHHLEKVCDGILGKCAGLPLAIITISSLLANQHVEEEWNRVLAAIGSALAKDSNSGNMAKILSLSYFDLPHNLRTCLLYLSVFPEDATIFKHDLINRWIAEGFIHEEQGRSTYEVGEGYFIELINRSLIQYFYVKDAVVGVETCQVHDIILDFAACKAAEENFVTSLNPAEHGQKSDYKVRRLRVGNHGDDEKVTIPTGLKISHVRSLSVFGSFVQHSLTAFPALRVLDLKECTELKDDDPLGNIGKLVFLKYLRLGRLKVDELPRRIGELQYLETLDISWTDIGELPSTITKLQRLARIYLSVETRIPGGIIGQLQSIEVLWFVISVREGWECLRELSQLKKLRTVMLGCTLSYESFVDLHNNLGALISSCNLRDLYIVHFFGPDKLGASLESFCPASPCSLRKLHLTYCFIYKVPSWMSLLVNLRELTLKIIKMTPEDVAILGAIPTLVFLKVTTECGSNGKIFIHGFRILKYFYLKIFSCRTPPEFKAGSMPKLEHLELDFPVHEMECPNDCFGIQHLSALTKVEVNIDEGKGVASLIKTAVASLPNLPTLSIKSAYKKCTRDDELEEKEPIEVLELTKCTLRWGEHQRREQDEMEE